MTETAAVRHEQDVCAQARRRLTGQWISAAAAQGTGLLVSLTLLVAGWYAAAAISRDAPATWIQPLHLLLVLALCLLDLLLLSPLRVGLAAFYRTLINGQEVHASQVMTGFRHAAYTKAVTLRAALWGRRTALYLAALCPAAVLLTWGDRLKSQGLTAQKTQLAYLLLTVAALLALLLGVGAAELWLLRYMPAWYLLPECTTVREAMRRARRMMRGQLGGAVWLYGRFSVWLPACAVLLPWFYAAPLFGASRAAWVEERRRESIEADVYFAPHRKNC